MVSSYVFYFKLIGITSINPDGAKGLEPLTPACHAGALPADMAPNRSNSIHINYSSIFQQPEVIDSA